MNCGERRQRRTGKRRQAQATVHPGRHQLIAEDLRGRPVAIPGELIQVADELLLIVADASVCRSAKVMRLPGITCEAATSAGCPDPPEQDQLGARERGIVDDSPAAEYLLQRGCPPCQSVRDARHSWLLSS